MGNGLVAIGPCGSTGELYFGMFEFWGGWKGT